MRNFHYIAAGAAIVVSAIAFFVAKNSEERVETVERRINKAVDGLTGITDGVINNRASDALINEAIERAAERRVKRITRNTADMIRDTIERDVKKIVYDQFNRAKSELNIKEMLKRKARSIVNDMRPNDISQTLEDDIKDAIIGEMKATVKQKIADTLL